MLTVSNSGPLISFSRARRLDILREVLGKLVIPQAVYEEIAERGGRKPGAREIRDAVWIERRSIVDRSFAESLPQALHLGEREAIALARELGATLLIDERRAREAAQRMGIHCAGALWVIKQAKQRNIVSAVKPVLDDLVSSGTYITRSLYRRFLHQVGEG